MRNRKMVGHDSLVKSFLRSAKLKYRILEKHRLSKSLDTISSANFHILERWLDTILSYLFTHTKSKYSGKAKRVEDTQRRFLEEN